MKIAHVNYLPTYLPGIQNKIVSQAQAAYSENLNIDFFILNSELESNDNNVFYKKITFPANGFLKFIYQKLFRYKIIESLIPFENYDYIILRYPLAMGLGMKGFYRRWGSIIITEHHTIEEQELKTYFQSKLLSFICSFMEKKYKHYICSRTAGMIGVTNEIMMYSNKELSKKTVISNGFDITSVDKSIRPKCEDRFNMIFIASRFAVWHGLDRVIESAAKYNGPHKINIKLVGKIANSRLIDSLNSFSSEWISFERAGVVKGEKLDKIYSNVHLGISSMGLYNIGLKEACVLKTREYIARLVPFIYGYNDSDLSGTEKFAYKASCDDRLIDFGSIINFYLDLTDNSNYRKNMENFASDYIDMRVKVNQMWDFVNKLSS